MVLPTVDGVTVCRNAVAVSPTDLSRLSSFAKSGDVIFNPNPLRVQRELPPEDPVLHQLVTFLVYRGAMEGRLRGKAVALHSFPGCTRQQMHTDYAPHSVAHSRVKPLGVLLALQTGTRFSLPDGDIELGRGDVLLFDGDQVHAGSAYRRNNTRVHVYLDAPGVLRPDNQTYLAPDAMPRKE